MVTFSESSSLKEIYLTNNTFTGQLNWFQLNQTTIIDVGKNNFTGTVDFSYFPANTK